MYSMWILITLFLSIHQAHAKILIFTYAYNRPDFIELQHKTFKRFLKNDYEFIVFNDAVLLDHYQAIHDICKQLNLICIDIPQEIHHRPYLGRPSWGAFIKTNQPSVRNSTVVQYSLDILGFNHDDILILIDSDMFLIKEFDARHFMNGYMLAGFLKSCCTDINKVRHSSWRPHTQYLWIGLVLIDMRSLPNKKALNFNCGTIRKVDVDAGGFTALYLNEVDTPLVRYIERICMSDFICTSCRLRKKPFCCHNTEVLKEHSFNEHSITFIQNTPLLHDKNKFRNTEFFLDKTFVHYRAASNYNNTSERFSVDKRAAFHAFIASLFNTYY